MFIKKLSELSPGTRIYSNLSPTMMNYTPSPEINAAIGADACYYHSSVAGVCFNGEEQPFGYRGIEMLFTALDKALDEKGEKA